MKTIIKSKGTKGSFRFHIKDMKSKSTKLLKYLTDGTDIGIVQSCSKNRKEWEEEDYNTELDENCIYGI